MTTNTEAVPLLSAKGAELCVEILRYRWGREDTEVVALEAIASGAAVVIPATERVDVELVRAVIADMNRGDIVNRAHYLLTAHWADELAAAIGDKT